MYKVLIDFSDMCDNGHLYHAGDIFPRDGYEPEKRRIEELSGSSNRRGDPIIHFVKDVLEESSSTKLETLKDLAEPDTPKKRGRKKAE